MDKFEFLTEEEEQTTEGGQSVQLPPFYLTLIPVLIAVSMAKK